jgi:hypothetical protein
MDNRILDIVESIVDGRNQFLADTTVRRFNWDTRTAIMTRYMLNESSLIDLTSRAYAQHIQQRAVDGVLIVRQSLRIHLLLFRIARFAKRSFLHRLHFPGFATAVTFTTELVFYSGFRQA